MDYQTKPDIDPNTPLTPQAVALFTRFRQDADMALVEERWEAEIQAHLRLCELAILRNASYRIYWADLPDHPIQDVATIVYSELFDRGFKQTKRPREAGSKPDVGTTVSWFRVAFSDVGDARAEWDRRVEAERCKVMTMDLAPMSRWEGTVLLESKAIWAAVFDQSYLVEVQRHANRNLLCVFSRDGRCVHRELTRVSYGAVFGADMGDVAEWEARVAKIVKQLETEGGTN